MAQLRLTYFIKRLERRGGAVKAPSIDLLDIPKFIPRFAKYAVKRDAGNLLRYVPLISNGIFAKRH